MCPTQRTQRDFAHVSSNALTTNSSEAALMKNRFYNEQQEAEIIDERRDKNEKFRPSFFGCQPTDSDL